MSYNSLRSPRLCCAVAPAVFATRASILSSAAESITAFVALYVTPAPAIMAVYRFPMPSRPRPTEAAAFRRPEKARLPLFDRPVRA